MPTYAAPDDALSLGSVLVHAGYLDTAQSVVDFFAEPWKYQRQEQLWAEAGRPSIEDGPSWQRFVDALDADD